MIRWTGLAPWEFKFLPDKQKEATTRRVEAGRSSRQKQAREPRGKRTAAPGTRGQTLQVRSKSPSIKGASAYGIACGRP